MSRRKYIELDWETPWSPLYGKVITIPENTIIWRSYDKSYPAIEDRFAYYSSKIVAEGYKKHNSRELGHFIVTRPLRLLDYRFMKVLLSRLIHINKQDKSLEYLAAIILSFGLCSLGHQIELVKMRYKNINKESTEYIQIEKSIRALESYYKPRSIIEQTGVRIAETTNDVYTMGFLQELFKGIFDGFISPRMYSPFHVEKEDTTMSPEMILFNPKDSGIKELVKYPNESSIELITINTLIYKNNGHILLDNVKKNGIDMNLQMEFFMCGGHHQVGGHYLDATDDRLNAKDNEIHTQFTNGKKAGSKWKKKMNLIRIETPHPEYTVSQFIGYETGV